MNIFQELYKIGYNDGEYNGYNSTLELDERTLEKETDVSELFKDKTNGDVIRLVFPKYYTTVLSYLDNTRWWHEPYVKYEKPKETESVGDKTFKEYVKEFMGKGN